MCNRALACLGLASVLVLCVIGAGCDSPSKPTALAVSAIAPSVGAISGATGVTILGMGFRVGATVSFGDVATPARIVTSTTIVADAPAHAAGLVDVVVTNPDGRQSRLTAGYRYGTIDTSAPVDDQPTFTLAGDVTEMTDAGLVPVEGLQVEVLVANRHAVTDSNGGYTIAGIRAMTSAVSASGPGYVTQSSSVTINGDTRLDIRVARLGPYTLSGTVYERTPAGRVPLEGVVLYCDSCGSPVGHTFVTTDVDGHYSFSWVLKGTTVVQLTDKEGYRYAGPPEHERSGIPVSTDGNTVFDIEFIRR